MTRPGGYFIYAMSFKKVTGYPDAGNDTVAFYDTAGNDTFTASPTRAELVGPAGSNIWNIAVPDVGIPANKWDTVLAYSQVGGYDKAYLTGTTGDDTFTALGMPRTTYPSGMGPGYARLAGTGYSLRVATFDEVYANVLTGDKDVAVLYDSTGPGIDQFWGSLHDAVLSDGTLDFASGNLSVAASYYFRVYGFDNTGGVDLTKDTVNLFGSAIGGTNKKHVVLPLDYALALTGLWTDE
jgi:hypothetical protein